MSTRRRQPQPSPSQSSLPPSGPPGVHLIAWDGEQFEEADHASEGCTALADRPGVKWLNIDGVHDPAVVQRICDAFHVHPLAVEDILNVKTRTKLDDYGDHVYVAIKEVTYDVAGRQLVLEQVSIIFGDRWVLTFQERPGDVFEGVRERLRSGRSRARKVASDWLVHSLLDAVVDAAFETTDQIDEFIDGEEAAATDNRDDTSPERVHALRAELVGLRRALSPLRESSRLLMGGELALLSADTLPYYRDLHDHVLQVLDSVDAARERLAWIAELHLSMTTMRTNDTMQVLTVVSSIFLPLTFVVGIYGMNFENMPELRWTWGYPAVMVAMGTLAVSLVAWYRHRRFL